MWSYKYLTRIDFRMIPVILFLMIVSLLIISSHSVEVRSDSSEDSFWTHVTRVQLQWFAIGWVVFFLVAGLDYNKLREWAWVLYGFTLIALLGLFFTDAIQSVHRWYRIPFLNISIQPSEGAKLSVVIALSWFLERNKRNAGSFSIALSAGLIVLIPFILILKQPDLGTALVLFPMSLVMFYFGDVYPPLVKGMLWMTGIALVGIACIFLGVISHEDLRPYATLVLKDYQFDRLDPSTHHQKAAITAIALGGMTGEGWRKGEYTAGGWLPTPYTDSVFPAFGEEFGAIGLILLMVVFYAMIYFSFQVTAVAKDQFGRLLSAGITVYLAAHILVNVGMMSGLLPITGVPLPLVTYGGTSSLFTMASLGLLQSIYSRRFMF
jgi:rod shape determining protein RodA